MVVAAAVVAFGTGGLAACEPSGGAGRCQALPGGSRDAVVLAFGSPADQAGKAPRPRERKDRVFNCSKGDSTVWRELKSYRTGVRTNGKPGKAARFYEWDSTHNDIEIYGPARATSTSVVWIPDRATSTRGRCPGGT